ncbi:MAG: hypothetical protein WCI64_06685 [Chlorobium sp.]
MNAKRKALHGQDAGLNREGRKDRADHSQPQYTTVQELCKDIETFGKELQHHRSVQPEPRVCVYGIASSVPFLERWR